MNAQNDEISYGFRFLLLPSTNNASGIFLPDRLKKLLELLGMQVNYHYYYHLKLFKDGSLLLNCNLIEFRIQS